MFRTSKHWRVNDPRRNRPFSRLFRITGLEQQHLRRVHCIVARSKDVLCHGRSSAANSAVCCVLGITSIDPERNDLLFERFMSEERREPPDRAYRQRSRTL